MSLIHRKVTIKSAFRLTTLPLPGTPFSPRPTSLPTLLTDCPAPIRMAHFPPYPTLLSTRPTHCPTCLVHTPTPQTPSPQGTIIGIPKEETQEGGKGKGEKAEEKKAEEKAEEEMGGQHQKEAKKEAEAPLTPDQRMSLLEKLSFIHQIYKGKV